MLSFIVLLRPYIIVIGIDVLLTLGTFIPITRIVEICCAIFTSKNESPKTLRKKVQGKVSELLFYNFD